MYPATTGGRREAQRDKAEPRGGRPGLRGLAGSIPFHVAATGVRGVEIGRFTFAGVGAVVTDDVQDYARILGLPRQRAGWMCRCGVRLSEPSGMEELRCKACSNEYRL
jgi:hypothetical protein